MLTMSGLECGGSDQSLSNALPSLRGWETGASVPNSGAVAVARVAAENWRDGKCPTCHILRFGLPHHKGLGRNNNSSCRACRKTNGFVPVAASGRPRKGQQQEDEQPQQPQQPQQQQQQPPPPQQQQPQQEEQQNKTTDTTVELGGNKRARTSSSPCLQPMDTDDALLPDGSAHPGHGCGEHMVHMVHMVQHNQIPAWVIETALPAELAFALLQSKNFEPGVRPAIFNAQRTPQFLFKEPRGEKTSGCKPIMPRGPVASSISVPEVHGRHSGNKNVDRWHNSGGSSIPSDDPFVPLSA
jgi:hypothetical protein